MGKYSAASAVPDLIGTKNYRRIAQADFLLTDEPKRWYLCTGPKLRTEILGWLNGQEVHFEDFGY